MKNFIVIISLLLSTLAFAEKINEVGKLEYNEKNNVLFFYFLKDNKIQSIVIHPKDKVEAKSLMELNGKSVVLEGEVKPYVKTNDNFVYQEVVDDPKVRELNAELLKIDNKKVLANLDMKVSKKAKVVNANSGAIGISDKSANTIIGVAGAVVGVAVGPIAFIPAAVYFINEGLKKD
jgi:hypothetical protein